MNHNPRALELSIAVTSTASRPQVPLGIGRDSLMSFLQVPPFPGAKPVALYPGMACLPDADVVPLIRKTKIGGTYWGAQPALPDDYILVRSCEAAPHDADRRRVVRWIDTRPTDNHPEQVHVTGECDPWHMLGGASRLVTSVIDEVAIIASILGIPIDLLGRGRTIERSVAINLEGFGAALSMMAYENPFTGGLMRSAEAINLCAFWRDLIDRNRGIAGALGFARWKQRHVAPLLWSGGDAVKFFRQVPPLPRGEAIAVWRSKADAAQLAKLEQLKIPTIEVEDGFLRSRGLGADCIPPLSITVDRVGTYFDPHRASELEVLLETTSFDETIIARARRLRELIVASRLAKYEQGKAVALTRPVENRRVILVPGQVEGDRAVQLGGCGLVHNLSLLERVRNEKPEAYIVYKPHPDVLAGHREGDLPERVCLEYADEVADSGDDISSLIEMVDEVHVNTSLAGFDALLRETPVTTYGVPFYAGWGLTKDLGPVPERRTARRTLDELVAAVLLIYPRYYDPVTGLPCPAEVVVERLTSQPRSQYGLLVHLRRLQGTMMRGFRNLSR